MSTYKRITRHPNTNVFWFATWHDNYFGPHLYGVEFPKDKVVYPAEQVEKSQLKELWFDDVIQGFRDFMRSEFADENDDKLVFFMDCINIAYNERWKRDPDGGEGAVENLRAKRGK